MRSTVVSFPGARTKAAMPRLEAAVLRRATSSNSELRASIEEQGRVLSSMRDRLIEALAALMDVADAKQRAEITQRLQPFMAHVDEALGAAKAERCQPERVVVGSSCVEPQG